MNYRLLALTLLVLPACSSKDDGSDAVDPISTLDGFCTSWAQAICSSDVATACGTTMDVCNLNEKVSCRNTLPTYADLSRGLIVGKARACVEAIRVAFSDGKLDATEYDTFKNFSGKCAGLDQEAVDAGNSQLVGGGNLCTAADTCIAGFYCKTDVGYCVVRPAVGAACCIDATTCNPVTPCQESAFCQLQDATTGASLCVARPAETQVCTPAEGCAEGLICSGATNGVCVRSIALNPSDERCVAMRQ